MKIIIKAADTRLIDIAASMIPAILCDVLDRKPGWGSIWYNAHDKVTTTYRLYPSGTITIWTIQE